MRKASPKVKLYLAKVALERYYRGYEGLSDEQEKQVRAFYKRNLDSNGLQKLRMRLLSQECSEMIVGTVIAEATTEEKIFLRDKYKLKSGFTAISCKLHVHPNGLQRWRDKFLLEIAQLLNYELPARDIWSYRKVSTLIRVLDKNVAFLKRYGGKADEASLEQLTSLRARYVFLQAGMEKYLHTEEKTTEAVILHERLCHVNMNMEELAGLTGYSHTTINIWLGDFLKQYYPTLEAV